MKTTTAIDLSDPRTRVALTPETPTYVGPLAICDEAELRRRNAIANAACERLRRLPEERPVSVRDDLSRRVPRGREGRA